MSYLDTNTGHLILPTESPFGRVSTAHPTIDLSPRTGLAYRLPDSTRTVFRAGYGGSYIEAYGGNSPMSSEIANAFSQNVTYSTIQPSPNLFFQGIPPMGPINLNNPIGTIDMINPLTKAAYAQQWDVSLQREFGKSWMVEGAYVGSKSTHLYEITDANQAIPGPGLSSPTAARFSCSRQTC